MAGDAKYLEIGEPTQASARPNWYYMVNLEIGQRVPAAFAAVAPIVVNILLIPLERSNQDAVNTKSELAAVIFGPPASPARQLLSTAAGAYSFCLGWE